VKCIKDEEHKVLIQEIYIKNRRKDMRSHWILIGHTLERKTEIITIITELKNIR